jgi:hypothetical protein
VGGQSGRAARLPRHRAWMLAVPLRSINGFPGCHGGLSLGVLGHLACMPGLRVIGLPAAVLGGEV